MAWKIIDWKNIDWSDVEERAESLLFKGRLILAVFNFGLLIGIAFLAIQFCLLVWSAISFEGFETFEGFWHALSFQGPEKLQSLLPRIFFMSEHDAIVLVLNMVDVALIANLLLMVSFVGWDHFVSQLNKQQELDFPKWLRTTDNNALKVTMMGSITAIAAIQLLQVIMNLSAGTEHGVAAHAYTELELFWIVAIFVAIIIAGLLLSMMDFLMSKRDVEPEGMEKSAEKSSSDTEVSKI